MVKEITDFEESRRCLLNSYNSNVQNHVGYIIAIVIGFVGLVLSSGNFFKNIHSNYPFIILIVLIFVIAGFWVFLRIKYWTNFASVVISLPEYEAINNFKKYLHDWKFTPYTTETPNTVILQTAIAYYLWDTTNHTKNRLCRLWVKCVLRTGGKSLILNNHEGNNLKSA
jgi:uncharacterized membrane protein